MNALPEFIVPDTEQKARFIQDELKSRLRLTNDFGTIETVAGIDVGYDSLQEVARASIVVMNFEDFKEIERASAFVPVKFPYVPGLLSFREIPALIEAIGKLSKRPDLLMVDGQGIAHPRRMGIAAHIGILLDIPSIGVAKSRLYGRYNMPGPVKGNSTPLMAGNERIGTVLRSREKTNPLFISPGHRIDIETATAFTLRALTRYRLPEPTRWADKYSKQAKAVK